MHAQVDDLAAGVTATIMDTNGDTNIVVGAVQRNGNVWAIGLPIAPGTNILSVTATNAAGISVTTNLTLVQSSVIVTMDPLSSDQYNQTSVNVTGTISSTNESLTVNDVSATISPTNGTWSATNVPVSAAGVAVFDLEASIGDPVTNASVQVATLLPPTVILSGLFDFYYFFAFNFGDPNTWDIDNAYWLPGVGGADQEIVWNGSASSSYTNFFTLAPDWDTAAPGKWARFGSASGRFFSNYFRETWVNSLALTTDGEGRPGTMQTYLVMGEAMDNSNGSNLPPASLKIQGLVLQDSGVADDYGGHWGFTGLNRPAGSTNDVSVSAANTNYDDNSIGGLLTLTIVSNSAVQINGTTNWATVENASNYVYVQAILTGWGNAAQKVLVTNIVWSGGESVPGNPLERKVSTAVSTNTVFTASIGPASTSLEVWVIWATINYVTNGPNPSSLPFESDVPGGNELGVQYTNNDSEADGKICGVATITPRGIHTLIPRGWSFNQMKQVQGFVNGTNF